jgi:hypothetical protein
LPSLPDPAEESAVVHRSLRAPTGYHGALVAGVRLPAGDGTLEGFALAFGATVGRCYAAVFETRASGAGAEQRIGRRLGVVVSGVLERIEARVVDDRAPHPEFPF